MKKIIQNLFCLIGCILLCGCKIDKKAESPIPIAGNEAIESVTNVEKSKGILSEDEVLDLGEHKVAYIVQDSKLTHKTGFSLHLAIEELETKKSSLYSVFFAGY